MIITFATQKGGTGKTTIAIAFANYLTVVKEKTVQVFDYDYQKSFYQKWMEDNELLPDTPRLYEVSVIDEQNQGELVQNHETILDMKDSEDIFLFDLAGNLDRKYSNLLVYSDFIIVPFSYSDVTCHSTLVFVNICGMLESESRLIFLRNQIDKNGKYPNREPMDQELRKYGILLENSVYKRNCLQTITTRKLNFEQKLAVKSTFGELTDKIKDLQNSQNQI